VCGVTTHLYNLSASLKDKFHGTIKILCGKVSYKEKFINTGIKIIENPLFLHNNRSILNYCRAKKILRQIVIENNIDIVHSFTHYAANIARNAQSKTKVITIQTNLGLLRPNGRLKHFNADKYVAVNQHIYDYMIANNIEEPSNIYFIRCGIPLPETMPVPKTDKIKFMAASKLTYDKGLDLFIKAVSMLPPEFKSRSEFNIIGEGELKNKLKQMNSSLNAGIIFSDAVEPLSDFLTNNNVFVFSGRSDTEGFPIAITEAAACGNLILTSKFRGVESVIKNKEDGIYFKTGNAEDLRDKISEIISHYSSYSNLPVNFFEKVKKWYSLDEMAQKHLILYNECRAE
jgi:glycosyltransferase involved in cell wall biosynthesis